MYIVSGGVRIMSSHTSKAPQHEEMLCIRDLTNTGVRDR